MLKTDPDGLVIVANSVDTALLCQQVKKLGSKIPVITSGWARTSDLVKHGGKAVENIYLNSPFNENSNEKKYLEFKKQFTERFGKNPNFAAFYGYESARVLFTALSLTDDISELKGKILEQKKFHSLQGDIEFDRFGDVVRKTFLFTVKEGKFVTIE